MGYSRMDIFQKCEAGLSNIKMFYKQPFINYNGRTTDTNELYTEVVAEFLSQNLDQFVAGFPVITRNQSYKTKVAICIRDLKFMCIDLYNGDCPGKGHLEISTS